MYEICATDKIMLVLVFSKSKSPGLSHKCLYRDHNELNAPSFVLDSPVRFINQVNLATKSMATRPQVLYQQDQSDIDTVH